jgi:hypothetical protein
MKFILLEMLCRMGYCLLVYILIYSLSYFNQALLFEYFSGIFINYYQTIEFNFYENLLNFASPGQIISWNVNQMVNTHLYFVNYISINESKSWSCLFLNNLGYFYCLQLQPVYLNFIINYNCLSYTLLYNLTHIYSLVLPGLLKYQKIYAWFILHILIYILTLLQFDNHCLFLMFLTFKQELNLEPIDSELQIMFKK